MFTNNKKVIPANVTNQDHPEMNPLRHASTVAPPNKTKLQPTSTIPSGCGAASTSAYLAQLRYASANNPTGNSINRNEVEIILNNFDGIVVIDEAYINYSKQRSFIAELTEYPNLVVMQTLSKAWGLAGLRLGMAFASQPIIELMNKVKYPYNINTATQLLALEALDNIDWVNEHIATTVFERENLKNELLSLSFTEVVYPSDANFLLAKMKNARNIYEQLCEKGIIVRDRSKVVLCDDCLRITIGAESENKILIDALNKMG